MWQCYYTTFPRKKQVICETFPSIGTLSSLIAKNNPRGSHPRGKIHLIVIYLCVTGNYAFVKMILPLPSFASVPPRASASNTLGSRVLVFAANICVPLAISGVESNT